MQDGTAATMLGAYPHEAVRPREALDVAGVPVQVLAERAPEGAGLLLGEIDAIAEDCEPGFAHDLHDATRRWRVRKRRADSSCPPPR